MPTLSGSTVAPLYAMMGVGRLGACRLGGHSPRVFVQIDGVERAFGKPTDGDKVRNLTITDVLNDAPSTASLMAQGWEPTAGMEVIVRLGSTRNSNRLFAGTILNVDKGYIGTPANATYAVNAVDYTWGLNQRKVSGHYTGTASEIVAAVMADFGPTGYTTNNVQAGLDTLDGGITFTFQNLTEVLTAIASRAPSGSRWYWYCDYNKDIHFFAVDPDITIANPTALTSSNPLLLGFKVKTDLSQLITRVFVQGAGSNLLVPVAAGSVFLPVQDATVFSASGGTVISPYAEQITYTGKSSNDGLGSTVAGILYSPGTVAAAKNASTAGNPLGAYTYKASFVLADGSGNTLGESELSAASSTVTTSAVSAPTAPSAAARTGGLRSVSSLTRSGSTATATTSASHGYSTGDSVTVSGAAQPEYNGTVTITVTGATTFTYTVSGSPVSPATGTITAYREIGGSVGVGAYAYKTTYVSSKGETLGSTASGSASVTAVEAASGCSASTSTANGALGIGTASALYGYKVAFLTSSGETIPAGSGSATIATVTAPGAGPTTAPAAGGSMTALATYYYAVTYITASGETGGGPTTYVTLTGANQSASLTSISTSSDARVTGRKIYRSKSGFSWPYYLVTTISNNTATTYTDTTADASLGVVLDYYVNTTAYGQVSLTSISTSSDQRVTGRVIYRTAANGSTFKRLVTINDNTTTTYTDNTPDVSLGADASTIDSSGGAQVRVTSLATSADGRVSARRLYRTKAGGSTYYLLSTIADNSTDYYIDNTADASLSTTLEPSVSTFGGNTIALSSIPLGPTGTTARRLYRTAAGGTVYQLLGTIGDNVTTTYADDKSDDNLGAQAPSSSGVGTVAASTTLPTVDIAQFSASGGWVKTGAQVIRYTGRSASSGQGNLTGIPASGTGSIAATVKAGAEIINAPYLSGVLGITQALAAGDHVALFVTRTAAAIDPDIEALFPPDGIKEEFLRDTKIASVTEAAARGDAVLFKRSQQDQSISVKTRDLNAASGRELVVSLASTMGVDDTYMIQRVTISNFQPAIFPDRTVEASPDLTTLTDVLRGIQANR
jgi:hypothetical protein